MTIQTIYQRTLHYAALKHGDQKVPGSDIPYVVHLSNVCMEVIFAAMHTDDFDLEFAVQVALLHDVLEDTPTQETELEALFGTAVTAGVKALTKNENLPKEEQMPDSLRRIKVQPKEIWSIKLADRITNLQPPPNYWTAEKIANYRQEAMLIYKELHEGNTYLAERLWNEIEKYQ